MQAYFNKEPTVSEREALFPADFLSAPEVQAATAFIKKYEDFLYETMGKEERWKNTNFCGSAYFGGFPSGDEALDALAQELWQQYELLPAAEGLYNVRGAFYPPEAIMPWGAFDSDYQKPGEVMSRERLRAWLGSGVADNWKGFRAIYSSGCFEDGVIDYLKKGCFYTSLVEGPPSAELPFWAYDTAWGGTVTIVLDERIGFGPSYLLYETEEAYVMAVVWTPEPRFLEETADCLDLRCLL